MRHRHRKGSPLIEFLLLGSERLFQYFYRIGASSKAKRRFIGVRDVDHGLCEFFRVIGLHAIHCGSRAACSA